MRSIEEQKKNPYTAEEVEEVYKNMSHGELVKEAFGLYNICKELTVTNHSLYMKGLELADTLDMLVEQNKL